MINLAIDIGNTNTHIGIFSKKLIKLSIFPTHNSSLIKDSENIFSLLTSKGINKCAVSSVVPDYEKFWENYLEIKFNKLPLIINNKTRLPVKINVKNSNLLGADRICNAVCGYEHFGKKNNVIVIDMGTAITYNVILKNGEFVGGVIAAGLGTAAKSLNIYTGKLPLLNKDRLLFPKTVIGDNTVSAIQSGLMNSALYAIEGMVNAIKKEKKRDFKAIITGGLAKPFHKKLSFKPVFIENTVLEGLNMIMNYNN